MTKREIRTKRKQWRENTRNYRQRQRAEERLVLNTPPSSPDDSIDIHEPLIVNRPNVQKMNGRKLMRRDRSKLFRENVKLKDKVKSLQRLADKFKKRYLRFTSRQAQASNKLSPKSRVENLIQGQRVSPEVKRKLLFGEALKEQLEENFEGLKKRKCKLMFARAVISKGGFLKKYRLTKYCGFLKYKQIWASCKKIDTNDIIKKRRDAQVAKQIMYFLEEDVNSRMVPGKKDCITRKKIKKQKRVLNDSLLNLHKKYVAKFKSPISYSAFCSHKPFWIVMPKVNDRDTCKCVICNNMEHIVSKLHSLKIIKDKSPEDMIQSFICSNRRESCLFRTCYDCKDKTVPYLEYCPDVNTTTSYKKWMTIRENYTDKNGELKTTSKVALTEVACSIGKVINDMENSLGKFMEHTGKYNHQFSAKRELLKTLKENEVMIHIDFSENYSYKYATEVQALHFGGSRQQVTLHTRVYYFSSQQETCARSFCSLSESLRHDPFAIWAHLDPVIFHILNKLPIIDTLHFWSDSPATQYRNKTMFRSIAMYVPNAYPSIKAITWNYSEAGHGKGAPDGVGGTLKRTADKLVAWGNDIPTFDHLVSSLKKNVKGVDLYIITPEMITEKETIVTKMIGNPKPFVNTMKVHQVLWSKHTNGCLSLRKLSCLICGFKIGCNHFHISSFDSSMQPTSENQSTSTASDQTSEHRPNNDELNDSATGFKVGDWVSVQYNDNLYPGEVVKIINGGLKVDAMEPTSNNKFKWPKPKDVFDYCFDDIVKKIGAPVPCDSRASQFYFSDFP